MDTRTGKGEAEVFSLISDCTWLNSGETWGTHEEDKSIQDTQDKMVSLFLLRGRIQDCMTGIKNIAPRSGRNVKTELRTCNFHKFLASFDKNDKCS